MGNRGAMLGCGVLVAIVSALGWGIAQAASCAGLPTEAQLKVFLNNAATNVGVPTSLGGGNCVAGAVSGTGCVGGLFGGTRMWGTVVDRDGTLCTFVTSTSDPSQTWPGSQAISKAKAYTANAFSLDILALSTAMLYTFSQPGHSLYGLNQSNPFAADLLAGPGGLGGGKGQIAGGIITFGGGVPLYNGAGHVVGGLGVSGDTACADHEIAKRARDLATMNPPGGATADDITYTGPSEFLHPHCNNTVQNGVSLGNETKATAY